jgi:cold shock CspA family protein
MTGKIKTIVSDRGFGFITGAPTSCTRGDRDRHGGLH